MMDLDVWKSIQNGLERKWTKRIIVQRKGQVAQSLFMALTHIAFASHVCYIAIPYIATKLYVANKKCVTTIGVLGTKYSGNI